jgi:hypothetical protein
MPPSLALVLLSSAVSETFRVRSVGVRTCLNELRRAKREILIDDEQLIAQHAIAADDPEVEYMKRAYVHEFRAAFGISLTPIGSHWLRWISTT